MSFKAGLYIHIPFCLSKCPYCDFYSGKYTAEAAEKYADEIIGHFAPYSGMEFDTVYFGGGTPSVIEPKLIAKILNSARTAFKIDDNSEITIECNPRDDLSGNFKIYADCGINRISIGMQSANNSELHRLGRIAGPDKVLKTITDARKAGINNISLDLMLGIPNQTKKSLEKTLEFVKKAQVQHISAYMLQIEKETPFYKLHNKLNLPGDDETADMYLETVEYLNGIGLKQYEISNFALPEYESRHNLKYWTLAPYLGIGKTAHSFIGEKRFYFDENFNYRYEGTGGTDEERIMLGLRLKKGISKSLIKKDITPLLRAGYMRQRGDFVGLTPKGFAVSNSIIAELI